MTHGGKSPTADSDTELQIDFEKSVNARRREAGLEAIEVTPSGEPGPETFDRADDTIQPGERVGDQAPNRNRTGGDMAAGVAAAARESERVQKQAEKSAGVTDATKAAERGAFGDTGRGEPATADGETTIADFRQAEAATLETGVADEGVGDRARDFLEEQATQARQTAAENVSPFVGLGVTEGQAATAAAGEREITRRAERGNLAARVAFGGEVIQQGARDFGEGIAEGVGEAQQAVGTPSRTVETAGDIAGIDVDAPRGIPTRIAEAQVGAGGATVEEQAASAVGRTAAFPFELAGGTAQAIGTTGVAAEDIGGTTARDITAGAEQFADLAGRATVRQGEFAFDRPVEAGLIVGGPVAAGRAAGGSGRGVTGRTGGRIRNIAGEVRQTGAQARAKATDIRLRGRAARETGGARGVAREFAPDRFTRPDPRTQEFLDPGARAGKSGPARSGDRLTLSERQQFASDVRASKATGKLGEIRSLVGEKVTGAREFAGGERGQIQVGKQKTRGGEQQVPSTEPPGGFQTVSKRTGRDVAPREFFKSEGVDVAFGGRGGRRGLASRQEFAEAVRASKRQTESLPDIAGSGAGRQGAVGVSPIASDGLVAGPLERQEQAQTPGVTVDDTGPPGVEEDIVMDVGDVGGGAQERQKQAEETIVDTTDRPTLGEEMDSQVGERPDIDERDITKERAGEDELTSPIPDTIPKTTPREIPDLEKPDITTPDFGIPGGAKTGDIPQLIPPPPGTPDPPPPRVPPPLPDIAGGGDNDRRGRFDLDFERPFRNPVADPSVFIGGGKDGKGDIPNFDEVDLV